MGQPRRITDSFPRRRRRRAGRAPGRAKLQLQLKPAERPRASPPAEEEPPTPPPPPPPPPPLLEMLRRFDLSREYGPCTGITRLQRWERAQALGLSPPRPVLDALLQHPENPDVTYCLWHQYEL